MFILFMTRKSEGMTGAQGSKFKGVWLQAAAKQEEEDLDALLAELGEGPPAVQEAPASTEAPQEAAPEEAAEGKSKGKKAKKKGKQVRQRCCVSFLDCCMQGYIKMHCAEANAPPEKRIL